MIRQAVAGCEVRWPEGEFVPRACVFVGSAAISWTDKSVSVSVSLECSSCCCCAVWLQMCGDMQEGSG